MAKRSRKIHITADTLQKRLQHIAKQIGKRPAGSEQELHAAQYMASQMDKYGLATELQEFPAIAWAPEHAQLQVSINGKWRESSVHPMAHSPSTPTLGIEAPIIDLGTGTEADLRGKDLNGKIGFVFGIVGDHPETLKRLCASGLKALLFVDSRLPMPWNVHAGLVAGWIDLLTIPAATVAYTEAWEIAKMHEPVGKLIIQTSKWEAKSQNVIASFNAQDSSLAPIYVTCHHDSVSLGEGAEDNGSGMAIMLAVAEALGPGTPPRPVKMLSCGWEENLSEGSRQYVAADIARAQRAGLVVNIDSVGSWMGKNEVSVVGGESLVNWTQECIDEVDFVAEVKRSVSPYSDMFPFNMVGVPSLWFYRSNLESSRFYHHSDEDTLDKMSFDVLADTANAVANIIWHLGGAPELPFDRAIPEEQMGEIDACRENLLDSICDWRTTDLMRPASSGRPGRGTRRNGASRQERRGGRQGNGNEKTREEHAESQPSDAQSGDVSGEGPAVSGEVGAPADAAEQVEFAVDTDVQQAVQPIEETAETDEE